MGAQAYPFATPAGARESSIRLARPALRSPFGVLARSIVDEGGNIVEAEQMTAALATRELGGRETVLTESVALASPHWGPDLTATVSAAERARRGDLRVQVRIGFGSLRGEVPARGLAYARCVADALESDLPAIAGRLTEVVLFSSAFKLGDSDVSRAFTGLVFLGGALRLADVEAPITLELANPEVEVPPHLKILFSPSDCAWLERAAKNAQNNADPCGYAIEHAAASMFGDLTAESNPPLRITVGGATEARFWGFRMRVRQSALQNGEHVAPAVGLILKALRVPWYTPTCWEPPLSAMRSPLAACAALDRAANPNRDPDRGGNGGLRREARALRRIANRPGVHELVEAVETPMAAARFVRESGLVIGPRLMSVLEVLP